MDEPAPEVIERTVELELDTAALWALVAGPGGWQGWLIDEGDLDLVPGGEGTVVDGGVTRTVRVDEVDEGEALRFRWWPVGEPERGSQVELVVVGAPGGSRLVVREAFPARPMAATMSARGALAWEVRVAVLWALVSRRSLPVA